MGSHTQPAIAHPTSTPMADASIMNLGCSEMTSQSRKHRGLRSQLVVANYLKPRGFPPNGVGETRISEWPCIVRLADLVTLLRASGYGDELPTGIRLPLGGVLREADPIEPWNQHIGDDS